MIKVILTGGGSLGPVTPLIALVEDIRNEQTDYQFVWVGTATGPEKKLVQQLNLKFYALATAKLHRYFTFKNLLMPAKFLWAIGQSLVIIWREQPQVLISVGGFTAVPITLVAKLWGVKIWVHEQDVNKGLANRILWPLATKTTSTFERDRAVMIGNLVRNIFRQPPVWVPPAHFSAEKPLLLITGGGTGSKNLNNLIAQALPELLSVANVVHSTGRGKKTTTDYPGYWSVESLGDEMAAIMQASALVITRGGLATLTELAFLAKPAIVVPMSKTHQEANVAHLHNNHAVVLFSENDSAARLVSTIMTLLHSPETCRTLGQNLHLAITDGRQKFKDILYELTT